MQSSIRAQAELQAQRKKVHWPLSLFTIRADPLPPPPARKLVQAASRVSLASLARNPLVPSTDTPRAVNSPRTTSRPWAITLWGDL